MKHEDPEGRKPVEPAQLGERKATRLKLQKRSQSLHFSLCSPSALSIPLSLPALSLPDRGHRPIDLALLLGEGGESLVERFIHEKVVSMSLAEERKEAMRTKEDNTVSTLDPSHTHTYAHIDSTVKCSTAEWERHPPVKEEK